MFPSSKYNDGDCSRRESRAALLARAREARKKRREQGVETNALRVVVRTLQRVAAQRRAITGVLGTRLARGAQLAKKPLSRSEVIGLMSATTYAYRAGLCREVQLLQAAAIVIQSLTLLQRQPLGTQQRSSACVHNGSDTTQSPAQTSSSSTKLLSVTPLQWAQVPRELRAGMAYSRVHSLVASIAGAAHRSPPSATQDQKDEESVAVMCRWSHAQTDKTVYRGCMQLGDGVQLIFNQVATDTVTSFVATCVQHASTLLAHVCYTGGNSGGKQHVVRQCKSASVLLRVVKMLLVGELHTVAGLWQRLAAARVHREGKDHNTRTTQSSSELGSGRVDRKSTQHAHSRTQSGRTGMVQWYGARVLPELLLTPGVWQGVRRVAEMAVHASSAALSTDSQTSAPDRKRAALVHKLLGQWWTSLHSGLVLMGRPQGPARCSSATRAVWAAWYTHACLSVPGMFSPTFTKWARKAGVTLASRPCPQHSAHQSAGPSPSSQATGPSPSSQSAGPSPSSQATGPSPSSQSTGPSPSSQSTGPSPSSQSTGPSPSSQATGPSPSSQSTGPSPSGERKTLTGAGASSAWLRARQRLLAKLAANDSLAACRHLFLPVEGDSPKDHAQCLLDALVGMLGGWMVPTVGEAAQEEKNDFVSIPAPAHPLLCQFPWFYANSRVQYPSTPAGVGTGLTFMLPAAGDTSTRFQRPGPSTPKHALAVFRYAAEMHAGSCLPAAVAVFVNVFPLAARAVLGPDATRVCKPPAGMLWRRVHMLRWVTYIARTTPLLLSAAGLPALRHFAPRSQLSRVWWVSNDAAQSVCEGWEQLDARMSRTNSCSVQSNTSHVSSLQKPSDNNSNTDTDTPPQASGSLQDDARALADRVLAGRFRQLCEEWVSSERLFRGLLAPYGPECFLEHGGDHVTGPSDSATTTASPDACSTEAVRYVTSFVYVQHACPEYLLALVRLYQTVFSSPFFAQHVRSNSPGMRLQVASVFQSAFPHLLVLYGEWVVGLPLNVGNVQNVLRAHSMHAVLSEGGAEGTLLRQSALLHEYSRMCLLSVDPAYVARRLYALAVFLGARADTYTGLHESTALLLRLCYFARITKVDTDSLFSPLPDMPSLQQLLRVLVVVAHRYYWAQRGHQGVGQLPGLPPLPDIGRRGWRALLRDTQKLPSGPGLHGVSVPLFLRALAVHRTVWRDPVDARGVYDYQNTSTDRQRMNVCFHAISDARPVRTWPSHLPQGPVRTLTARRGLPRSHPALWKSRRAQERLQAVCPHLLLSLVTRAVSFLRLMYPVDARTGFTSRHQGTARAGPWCAQIWSVLTGEDRVEAAAAAGVRNGNTSNNNNNNNNNNNSKNNTITTNNNNNSGVAGSSAKMDVVGGDLGAARPASLQSYKKGSRRRNRLLAKYAPLPSEEKASPPPSRSSSQPSPSPKDVVSPEGKSPPAGDSSSTGSPGTSTPAATARSTGSLVPTGPSSSSDPQHTTPPSSSAAKSVSAILTETHFTAWYSLFRFRVHHRPSDCQQRDGWVSSPHHCTRIPGGPPAGEVNSAGNEGAASVDQAVRAQCFALLVELRKLFFRPDEQRKKRGRVSRLLFWRRSKPSSAKHASSASRPSAAKVLGTAGAVSVDRNVAGHVPVEVPASFNPVLPFARKPLSPETALGASHAAFMEQLLGEESAGLLVSERVRMLNAGWGLEDPEAFGTDWPDAWMSIMPRHDSHSSRSVQSSASNLGELMDRSVADSGEGKSEQSGTRGDRSGRDSGAGAGEGKEADNPDDLDDMSEDAWDGPGEDAAGALTLQRSLSQQGNSYFSQLSGLAGRDSRAVGECKAAAPKTKKVSIVEVGGYLSNLSSFPAGSYSPTESLRVGSSNKRRVISKSRVPGVVQGMVSSTHRVVAVATHIPFVIPFSYKLRIFEEFMSRQAMQHAYSGRRRITVQRDRLVHDGIAELMRITYRGQDLSVLRSPMHVTFIDRYGQREAGVDANGLYKEFMEEFVKQVCDPNYCLFESTADGLQYPSPRHTMTDNSLGVYRLIGAMWGACLLNGILIPPPLSADFLATFAGGRNTVGTLHRLDPELYRQWCYLRDYDGDIAELFLSFSVAWEAGSVVRTVNLVPGGSEMDVTEDNRQLYLYLLANYYVHDRMYPQARALSDGFSQVVPMARVSMFSPDELQLLLCGSDQGIDVDDWRDHTLYKQCNANDTTITQFWKVVESLEARDRAAVLKFVTSCERPPLSGFKALRPQFTIVLQPLQGGSSSRVMRLLRSNASNAKDAQLPSAATCFNTLKLPNYKDAKVLKAKLLQAVHGTSGFELA